jgi:hypothetical protein
MRNSTKSIYALSMTLVLGATGCGARGLSGESPYDSELAADNSDGTAAGKKGDGPAIQNRVVSGQSSGCASKGRSLDRFYAKSLVTNDLCIVGSSTVSDGAFLRAEVIMNTMLGNRPDLRATLVKNKFRIEIIGSSENLTDLPTYKHLAIGQIVDGRSWDQTRGVGGATEASIGEENLLCKFGQPYGEEDIFVHELSHSIMSNLSQETQDKINRAYASAKSSRLYDPKIYMMATAQEYWAEGTQAWFDKSVRLDVNGGINSRQKLWNHDPSLANLMKSVYGDTTLNKVHQQCKY